MATMNEENLFSEFEDLEATGDNKDDMVDDDDDYLPPRKLASEMVSVGDAFVWGALGYDRCSCPTVVHFLTLTPPTPTASSNQLL